MRILPAAVAGFIFIVLAALYATGQQATYESILRAWGVDPFRFPFLDTETVLSAVRCLKAGVDVFATNPCDPVRRVFDYSPLWLLLAKLPVTEAWLTPAGLLVDVAFIASLLLLPAGRSASAAGLIVLGVASSATVFAVERANNDLVLFVLVAAASALLCRTPMLRYAGYGAILLAGLLKYYPMTLMAMATRERPGRFIAVAAASLVAVALFLATMGEELVRALHLIPIGQLFGDMFGSAIFANGIVKMNDWPAGIAVWLRVVLVLTAFGAGIFVGLRPAMGAGLARISEAERTTLLAGGLLMVSCYFTANNIGYRAVHLILTLPALTALWRLRAWRLAPLTIGTTLAVLWAQGWRNWIAELVDGRAAVVGLWAFREALWWWTITMMIALVAALLARSDVGRQVMGRRAL
jgi:hypothetical protein